MKGTLYLIPSPIGDTAIENIIPRGTLDILLNLKHFVVEELRTVRRYLSKAGLKGNIESLELYLLNKNTNDKELDSYLSILLSGISMGMISEAGLPAVADPGAKLVALAHKNDIEVVPLVGPSSLMLALMASGKNGQSFAFVGYLPIKAVERRSKIRELEKLSLKTGQSQIIMETPYRNDALLADFLLICSDKTLLTVAANITTPGALIKTKSVAQWKREKPVLNKKPSVFIL